MIAYTRASTQFQVDSGLGLEAQRAVIDAETTRRGWSEVIHLTDHARSGKNLDRPGIAEALELLRTGKAGTSRGLLNGRHATENGTHRLSALRTAAARRWTCCATRAGCQSMSR